jgi:hypothetical protein
MKGENNDEPYLWSSSRGGYDIYTGKDGYIQYEDFSFKYKGELKYYSIGKQKIYDATLPENIRKEMESKISSRLVWKKRVRVSFTVLPEGIIDLRVEETGKGDSYYNKDILLYENSYQAKSYPLSMFANQLQKYAPVPIEEWADLLNEKYNWILDIQPPETPKKDIDVESVTYRYFSDESLYEVRENVSQFLPCKMWINKERVEFDVEVLRGIFNQAYLDKNPDELSQIKVVMNDSLKVKSITLVKDNKEIPLKYSVEKR